MKQIASWIWANEPCPSQNYICCFSDEVLLSSQTEKTTIRISADTRYVLYCNGHEIGRGPIRSVADHWFYDTYDLSLVMREGKNHIAVRVWHYGISNYQYIAHTPGLWYEIYHGDRCIQASAESTKYALDVGLRSFTVKRNANMGFMEHYDARQFSSEWSNEARLCADWKPCKIVEGMPLFEKKIKPFHTEHVSPKRVVAFQETKADSQQVSLNLRQAFFPNRVDINASIFTGFLAVCIKSPCDMQGVISFPNRTWNGIIGDFRLNGTLYPVDNASRDITVQLAKGIQLFLLQIAGKFDDLFCHIDFIFSQPIQFVKGNESDASPFFVIGPTDVIYETVDGVQPIYGGLEEFNRFESHTQYHARIFSSQTIEDLSAYKDKWIFVEAPYLYFDEYVYSLVKHQQVVCDYAIHNNLCGLLWQNDEKTIIPLPEVGDTMNITIDFEDIYVGALTFSLDAPVGTILDIYGYENRYGEEIDFTVGLNNATRYICKEGMQSYTCMARTGARYLLLRLYNYTRPVQLIHVGMQYSRYATSGAGTFRCNDAQLETIWKCAKHTHELCVEDTFTDCPTYEQAFWIGDAQVSANINAMVFGEYDMMRHCLEIAVQTKQNTPLYNALGPTDWTTNIPMWTMNWLLAIKQYVHLTDDVAALQTLYPEVREVLHTYATFIEPNGMFLINAWNMIDWAAMDLANHCACTAQQAILTHCYAYYATVAQQLHHTEDADFFTQCYQRLCKGIDESLWLAEKDSFTDGWSPETGYSTTVSIQTHMMLLLFDAIIDPVKKEKAMRYVQNPPEEFIQIGSPFMLFYLYELFAQQGNFEVILQDMKERWGMMLRYDCTTCWEVFPGFYEVGRTRSYCHAWSSAPVYFCNRYFLGVQSIEAGDKKLRLHVPDISLQWCEGSIPSTQGTITVRWEKTSEAKTYYITLPDNITLDTSAMVGWHVHVKTLRSMKKETLPC